MIAEECDEDRLHERDEQRPALEEDFAHPPERQVERGIAGAQRQKRADRPGVVQAGPGLDQDVTHHDAEPAQLDHGRLGRELPARERSVAVPTVVKMLLRRCKWAGLRDASAFRRRFRSARSLGGTRPIIYLRCRDCVIVGWVTHRPDAGSGGMHPPYKWLTPAR